MEPSPARVTVVPKLHLLTVSPSHATRFPKLDTLRAATEPSPPPCSRRLDHDGKPPTRSRVSSPRLYNASVSYLQAPPEPALSPGQYAPHAPSENRNATPRSSMAGTTSSNRSKNKSASKSASKSEMEAASPSFLVLHPSLDAADASGALSQLLLQQWSASSTTESAFASVSLYCEMKLHEAKRMTSWVEAPNRFFITVCCQLFDRYVRHLEQQQQQQQQQHHHTRRPHKPQFVVATDVSNSAAFLRCIHDELITGLFLPTSDAASGPESDAQYEHRVPFFTEYKTLKLHAQTLLTTVHSRERRTASRHCLPVQINRVLLRRQVQVQHHTQRLVFRAWAASMRALQERRRLQCVAFRASRGVTRRALFRAWRLEALRRAYQRESGEYQSMLSVTAASLSRKEAALAESERKVVSMAKIIDGLTESNAQLLHRVDQLEAVASGRRQGTTSAETLAMGISSGYGYGYGGYGGYDGGPEAPMDSAMALPMAMTTTTGALVGDDEKMDRTNRMLLETMLGMARMVEASAIQLAKDTMDSLEAQLDGSLLRNLVDMLNAENAARPRSEESRVVASPATPNSPTRGGGRSSSSTTTRATLAIHDLVHMPTDAFLLAWFRMHLQLSSAAERASDRTVKNFTSDLADGRRLSLLLHRLYPTWFDASMVHELDVDERLKHIASFHARVQPELPQVVTSDSIHAGSATENVAFVAMLFGASVAGVRRINLERQRGEFLHLLTAWKRVRSLLLEVKRMHDNYDALMLAHVFKEMRTCETLFKQLNGELSAMAVAANESASTMAHVAYQALRLTWRCLHAKMTHQLGSLHLVDERVQERLRDFVQVDKATVRHLLMHDAQQLEPRGDAIPEKDVLTHTAAMRDAVRVYAKDLHDIFTHYSASSGAGSIASMSLAEFLKLAKDCALSDKLVPTAKLEQIYRAALTCSPLGVPSHDTAGHPADSAPDQTTATTTTVTEHHDPKQERLLHGDGGSSDHEMTGLEFVDALIRLAAAKYAPSSSSSTNASCSSSSLRALDARFRELLDVAILPHAQRAQAELFRAEVASPKVRAVFQKHKPALQSVFRYYAAMHALHERQSTLSLRELTVFARDCKLIGTFVTEHTLKQVLVHLQHDEDDDAGGGVGVGVGVGVDASGVGGGGMALALVGDAFRIDFGDFQEALAALTQYVICNPYVPLYTRVEQFINELVLPRAKQKKARAGGN